MSTFEKVPRLQFTISNKRHFTQSKNYQQKKPFVLQNVVVIFFTFLVLAYCVVLRCSKWMHCKVEYLPELSVDRRKEGKL